MAGANKLRISFYQRANRFYGCQTGLNKSELLYNSHFRVLFIRGIYKEVNREQFQKMCAKYGAIESITLKTAIIGGKVESRGIGIVQYQTKSEAADALKNLPFQTDLGDFLQVDFY